MVIAIQADPGTVPPERRKRPKRALPTATAGKCSAPDQGAYAIAGLSPDASTRHGWYPLAVPTASAVAATVTVAAEA